MLKSTLQHIFKDLSQVAFHIYKENMKNTVQNACDTAVTKEYKHSILETLYPKINDAKRDLYYHVMSADGPYKKDKWRMKRRKYHKLDCVKDLKSLRFTLNELLDDVDDPVQQLEILKQIREINYELEGEIEDTEIFKRKAV